MLGIGIRKIMTSVTRLTVEVNTQIGNVLRHHDAVSGCSFANGMHDILRRICCASAQITTKPSIHRHTRRRLGFGKMRRYWRRKDIFTTFNPRLYADMVR